MCESQSMNKAWGHSLGIPISARSPGGTPQAATLNGTKSAFSLRRARDRQLLATWVLQAQAPGSQPAGCGLGPRVAGMERAWGRGRRWVWGSAEEVPAPSRPRTRAPSAAWSRWALCVCHHRGLGSALLRFEPPQWAPWTRLSCRESFAGAGYVPGQA